MLSCNAKIPKISKKKSAFTRFNNSKQILLGGRKISKIFIVILIRSVKLKKKRAAASARDLILFERMEANEFYEFKFRKAPPQQCAIILAKLQTLTCDPCVIVCDHLLLDRSWRFMTV